MSEMQLDLFSASGVRLARGSPGRADHPPPAAADLDDAALVAAIPDSDLAHAPLLAAEAGRRRLAPAVPALEMLCRRFSGFGADRLVPEQAAALEALALIGDRAVAQAVGRMIVKAVVQGPALSRALGIAADLRSSLPADVVLKLLRHASPGVRADACRCARPSPEAIAILIDLLDDLDATVARSAACALGRMGRIEARAMLLRLLRESPSEDVIDAVAPIADEECIVLLGRIARAAPELAEAALDALDGLEHPRAAAVATAVRKKRPDGSRTG